MANRPQPFLSGWAEIDAKSDLARLRLVMLAMALCRIRIGQMEKLRSLTAPVNRAA